MNEYHNYYLIINKKMSYAHVSYLKKKNSYYKSIKYI